MSEPIVAFSEVSKAFGDFRAVDDLSFAIEPGRVAGFLGPNGAGKTTSIRMMLGIMSPDTGDVELFGAPSKRSSRARIGYLPEERGLYKRMRTIDVIAYLGALKGMTLGAAREKGLALLRQFGLGDYARVRIEGLSRGMSQKVQIIASVVHDPAFLILDEPFSGLDPVNQEDLEVFIRDLAAAGKTVLFSTHTMEHAERLCDQLIVIAGGRKLFDGTLDGARDLLPRRVVVGAEEDLSFLSGVDGVVSLQAPQDENDYWQIELADGADGRAVIAACFERRIVPTHFEIVRASLHDVFVSLVGGDAGEARGGKVAQP